MLGEGIEKKEKNSDTVSLSIPILTLQGKLESRDLDFIEQVYQMDASVESKLLGNFRD